MQRPYLVQASVMSLQVKLGGRVHGYSILIYKLVSVQEISVHKFQKRDAA